MKQKSWNENGNDVILMGDKQNRVAERIALIAPWGGTHISVIVGVTEGIEDQKNDVAK